MKYVIGILLILIGILMFVSDLPNLPAGIVAFRQGNYAGFGAATGGLLFGPLIVWGGIALLGSARRQSRESKGPEISAADRVRNPDDSAE